MQLHYVEATGQYVLRVPRQDGGLINQLMREHGLDCYRPSLNEPEVLLMTQEPYAAVAFRQHATPEAIRQLSPIIQAIDESWMTESRAHICCPADQELFSYQRAGVEYIMRRGGGLVADAPGLGKTAQAICVSNEMRAKRVLVICPAAIRLQWYKAIQQWSTMEWPYTIHPILSSKNGTHPTAAWTIVSYDLASSDAIGQGLSEQRFDLLILDEAHFLKEPLARRTKAIFGGGRERTFHPIASRCGAVVALTGTPLPNRPRECFVLTRHICWDAIDWQTENAFESKYNPRKTIKTRKGIVFQVDERTGRTHELQARLRGNFMVRREKRGPGGVLNQLKLPAYDLISMQETTPVKMALQAESMLHIDPETLEGADAQVLGHIAAVRQQMGVALAPQVADYVDMLIDGGEDKLILFGHHIAVLNILQLKLAKHGLVRIDGSTSTEQRRDRIAKFIADPGVKIFLGNTQAAGTGVDGLQDVANHVILAEPDWVPGVNQQAIDRADRIGQRHSVQADFIVAPGSIAERVLASALRKMRNIHNALDSRL